MTRIRFPRRGDSPAWAHAPMSLFLAVWAVAATAGIYQVGAGRIGSLRFVAAAGGALVLLLVVDRWLARDGRLTRG